MILPELLSIVVGIHPGLCKADATPCKPLVGVHNRPSHMGCSVCAEPGPAEEL